MKINEVEERLQISKANIRFYEKEGLITPDRTDNGYRNYSENDIEILRKIIILRKLDMSIPDIKDVFSEKITMADALSKTVKHLEEELAKLYGSIELAKTMEKDDKITKDFDTDYYWNYMQKEEEKGLRFMDIVSDYMEIEKKSLIAVFEGVLFTPLGYITEKTGWKIGFLFVLLICLIRGIMSVVHKTGSFLEGFGYPFLLFGFITLLILPLYIIDYKYKDEPIEHKKKSPIWLTLLKFIGIVAYIPVVLIGGMLISEKIFFPGLIKEESWIINNWIWPLYFITSMYLFFALVWLYSRNGLFGKSEEKMGFVCHLPKKVKTKVLIGSILVYLFGFLCYHMCYDCFTLKGVERRIFFYSNSYTWEDVDYYTLDTGTDGMLKYTVVMNDGFKTECLSTSVSSYSLSEEEFPNGQEEYCIYLTKIFAGNEVELKNTDWDKLMEKLDDYWKEYAGKLREIVENIEFMMF